MNLSAWNGKREVHFEDFTLIWEDNIRMDTKEMGLLCGEWIHLDQEKGMRRVFVNSVIHKMRGNFFSRWKLLDSQEGPCSMELVIFIWL
jgi:hypothetical protein